MRGDLVPAEHRRTYCALHTVQSNERSGETQLCREPPSTSRLDLEGCRHSGGYLCSKGTAQIDSISDKVGIRHKRRTCAPGGAHKGGVPARLARVHVLRGETCWM